MRRSVRQRTSGAPEKTAARSNSPSNSELTVLADTPRVSPTPEGSLSKYGTPGQKSDGTPKRPMNAFILYSNEKRSEFADLNPHLSNAQVSTLLGQSWRDMPAAEKAPYVAAAKRIKEDFHAMHPDAKTRCVSRKKRKLEAAALAARARAPLGGAGGAPLYAPHQPQGGGRYYPMYAQNFNPQQTDLYRGSAASSSFGGRSDDYYDDDDEEGEEGMGHEEGGAQYARPRPPSNAPHSMSLLETLCTVAENEHTAAAHVLSAFAVC